MNLLQPTAAPPSLVFQLLPILQQLDPASLVAGLAAGFAFAAMLFALVYLFAQRRQLVLTLRLEQAEKDRQGCIEEIQQLRQERDRLARDNREIDIENASLQTACTVMQRQVAEREDLLLETRRQIEQDFQVLSGRILGEQGEMISQRHQSGLTALLRPFHDQLQEFRRKVDDVYDREARDRVAMLKEIQHLRQLNQQVGAEAASLAEALRGKNKTQGQWGEMVLTRLLEASGLRNGSEFSVQVHLRSEDGAAYQPDVLIHLPENRSIIIDAKMSLKAFLETHQTTDEELRQRAVRRHLDSIRKHVAQLAAKQYHQLTGLGSIDFVLLFIPIEGAFQLAVEQDPELLASAMNRKVILTSPSTLLAILRTINHLWRMDEQGRNSLSIAKQAGNLYDKLVGFVEAFEDIGLRLNQTQQAWHTAKNRLASGQGNLIARAEALRQLGVQSSKELPEALRQSASVQGDPP